MTAILYGPWPAAGTAGTVTILNSLAVGADEVTAHVYHGNVYYTVIKA